MNLSMLDKTSLFASYSRRRSLACLGAGLVLSLLVVARWYSLEGTISTDDVYDFLLPSRIGSSYDPDADLDQRLTSWLNRSYTTFAEVKDVSREACPADKYYREGYWFHSEYRKNMWRTQTSAQVTQYRNDIMTELQGNRAAGKSLVWKPEMLRPPYQSERESGKVKRGIIYSGGKGKSLERLRTSLHMLRRVVNSTLPVEIYHFPDEMQDEGVRYHLMNDYGADVTLVAVEGAHAAVKNYNIKTLAMLQTQFTELIWIDNDNVPLVDPATMFNSVEYRRAGSVWWPDMYKDHPDNLMWRIAGMPCFARDWASETGQILFDKRANKGLNLAMLYIAHHITSNLKYENVLYGDKDAFRLAAYILDLPYESAPRLFASVGGYKKPKEQREFCGHAMLQYALTPSSQHSNRSYRHTGGFLHINLAKLHKGLTVPTLFTHALRPHLNKLVDPAMERTPANYNGWCFSFDYQPLTEEVDEQSIELIPLQEELLVPQAVWNGLMGIRHDIIRIQSS